MTETNYSFRGKYLEANPISRALVDGFYDNVFDLVARARAEDVVEVGCGEGFSTEKLRAFLPPSVPLRGLEIEDRLIAEARQRNPTTEFIKGSIYELPFADASIDTIVCLEVLEHLDAPAKALVELCRVARRHLVLSVPREPLWRALNFARGKYVTGLGNTPGHLNHWSRRQFTAFVERKADVVVVRSPVPWTIVLARPRRHDAGLTRERST